MDGTHDSHLWIRAQNVQLEMLAWARLRLGGGVENPRKLPLIGKSATNPTTSNDAKKESANQKRHNSPG